MNTKFLLFLIRRILVTIITVISIITIIFILLKLLPGSPFDIGARGLPEGVKKSLEKRYHLNGSVIEQYFYYLKNSLSLDFGESIIFKTKTIDLIKEPLKKSLLIGSLATLLTTILVITTSTLAALNKNSLFDKIITKIFFLTSFVPSFILAIIILWLSTDVKNTFLRETFLPVISLSIPNFYYQFEHLYSDTVNVIESDFIRIGKAKGLKRKDLLKHILRNSLAPMISRIGIIFAFNITGSITAETTFKIMGLGNTFISSIYSRDYPVILGTSVVISYIFILSILLSDVIYKIMNPKQFLANE